jgi:hypothetical protein
MWTTVVHLVEVTAEGTFRNKEVTFVATRAFIKYNAMELARFGHGYQRLY